MRRALLLLFLPFPVFAADPFACVDRDIFDAFVGNPHAGPARFSTEVPAKLADLPLPAGLEPLGSMTRGSDIEVAYRSAQDADTTLSSTVEVLKRAGWIEPGSWSPFSRGFQSGSEPRTTALCHPSEPGALNIQANNRAGHALLTISLSGRGARIQCAAEPVVSPLIEIPLQRYLPDLQVPEGAELRHKGAGGSNDEYSIRVIVLTTSSRDTLLRHFDDQLRAQGWTADSAWSGGMTAGTVWTRKDPDDRPLVGTMRIAEGSAGVFNAHFTVMTVTPGDGVSGSSWTSSFN